MGARIRTDEARLRVESHVGPIEITLDWSDVCGFDEKCMKS